MSHQLNFLKFIKQGEEVLGIRLNSYEEDLFKELGQPTKTIGDKTSGFYHYKNGIRFGYSNKRIDELAIFFFSENGIHIPLKLSDGDDFFLTEKSQIHKVIFYLNDQGVPWKSNDESNQDVFSIVTDNNVYLPFDLETGFITKIAVS